MRVTVVDVRGFNVGMWLACAGRSETLLTRTGAKAAEVAAIDPADRSATFDCMWLV